MEHNQLSRRSFLGIGAAAATLAGAGLIGCSTDDQQKNGRGATGTEWDKETEVLIIGYGGAGAAAAIDAAEAGAQVTILEMSGVGGGATRLCEGIIYMGGGTRLQKACGFEDTPENMHAYLKAFLGDNTNDELLQIYCDQSPALFDWLESHGVEFHEEAAADLYDMNTPPGTSLYYTSDERSWEYAQVAEPFPRSHVPAWSDEAEESGARGPGLFEPLDQAVQDLGVEVIYEAQATELLQDEEGRVIGVVATVDDTETFIKATKGVLLSCGAFSLNNDMLQNTNPASLLMEARTAGPNDQGYGHVLGMEIGAATRNLGGIIISSSLYIFGTGLASGVLVDGRGHRFASEDSNTLLAMKVFESTPLKSYVIVDSEMKANMDGKYAEYVTYTFEADSIEDLADQMEIDPTVVINTIERYNTLCDSGVDLDFHKADRFLAPVRTAPFSAFDFSVPTQFGFFTLGGLAINDKAQVTNVSGEVIPGLYAAGRNAATIFGPYIGSGGSTSECMTFGRIAGQNLAAE